MDLMTVTGPVAKDALGVVLPHEHLFIDLRNQFTEFDDPEKRALSHLPVCMRHLGTLRANPYAMKDNLLLDNVDTAVEEISHVAAEYLQKNHMAIMLTAKLNAIDASEKQR